MAISAVVFDAYGTLFDVAGLEAAVAAIVPNDAAAFTALWRAKQLEYAFLRTLMERWDDFWQLTIDALEYAIARYDLALDDDQRATLMQTWLAVPAYDDALPTLVALEAYRLAVLSNGTPAMLAAALGAANILERFTAVLSVDLANQFKPAPAVYDLAATALDLVPDQIGFVSANGWDIAGAASSGFQTVWINRAGLPTERLGVAPRATIMALAELPMIINGWNRSSEVPA